MFLPESRRVFSRLSVFICWTRLSHVLYWIRRSMQQCLSKNVFSEYSYQTWKKFTWNQNQEEKTIGREILQKFKPNVALHLCSKLISVLSICKTFNMYLYLQLIHIFVNIYGWITLYTNIINLSTQNLSHTEMCSVTYKDGLIFV